MSFTFHNSYVIYEFFEKKNIPFFTHSHDSLHCRLMFIVYMLTTSPIYHKLPLAYKNNYCIFILF